MKKRYWVMGSVAFLLFFLSRKKTPLEVVMVESDTNRKVVTDLVEEVVDTPKEAVEKEPEGINPEPKRVENVGISTVGSGISTTTSTSVKGVISGGSGSVSPKNVSPLSTNSQVNATEALLGEIRDLRGEIKAGTKSEVSSPSSGVEDPVVSSGVAPSVGGDAVESPEAPATSDEPSNIRPVESDEDRYNAYEDFIRREKELSNGPKWAIPRGGNESSNVGRWDKVVSSSDIPLEADEPAPIESVEGAFAHDLDGGQGEALEMAGLLGEIRHRISEVRSYAMTNGGSLDFIQEYFNRFDEILGGNQSVKEKIKEIYNELYLLEVKVRFEDYSDTVFLDKLGDDYAEILRFVKTSYLFDTIMK